MSNDESASEPPSGGSASCGVAIAQSLGDAPRGYRFLLFAVVVNFAVARRRVGPERAGPLLDRIAAHLATAIGDGCAFAIGGSTIEIQAMGDDIDSGRAIVAAIQQALAEPVAFDGESHMVRVVVGGAGGRVRDSTDIDLLDAAERASQEARVRGSDVIDDLADPKSVGDAMELMRDLPAAIANGEMFLQYQPKLNLRRQCVAGAEALVRWRHPVRGLILPGSFIEMAERCMEITALTLWTIRQVIADQRWLAAQGHDFPVFVNVSAVLLSDEAFVGQACALIEGGGASIGIEITETAVLRDPETAILNLKRLSAIGVRLAIDDYGAGLSSLSYLKRLPARELKIDKSFVTELSSSNRDPLIVRSTIDLAHALGMEVTAEGVETAAVLALLSVMGCDMAQGYFISRPIELAALKVFLDENRHVDAMASPRLSFRRAMGQWH